MRLRILLPLAPIALGGCAGATAPVVRTDEARPGIAVQVKDGSTNEWIAAGARLIVIDQQGVTDTTTFPADRADLDSLALSGAYEQAGVFQVRIDRAGYQPWVRSDVRVTADQCHVRTTLLVAELAPE